MAILCSEKPWCFSCSCWLLRNLVVCCVPDIPLTVRFVHAMFFSFRLKNRWTSEDPATSRFDHICHCTMRPTHVLLTAVWPCRYLIQYPKISQTNDCSFFVAPVFKILLLTCFFFKFAQTFYWWVCLRIWTPIIPWSIINNVAPFKQTCEVEFINKNSAFFVFEMFLNVLHRYINHYCLC